MSFPIAKLLERSVAAGEISGSAAFWENDHVTDVDSACERGISLVGSYTGYGVRHWPDRKVCTRRRSGVF